MKNLICLVLVALLGITVDVIVRPYIQRCVQRVSNLLEKYAPRLKHSWNVFHRSRFGASLRAFLSLLGLLTVLYVVAFGVLVFAGGAPTVDVPSQDIYVPYGEQGEARIVVLDRSFRGLLLKDLFPPTKLMQVRVTAKSGQLAVVGAGPSELSEEVVLRVHHAQVVVIRYAFANGYEFGDVQVSVSGLWDKPQKDAAAQTWPIRFFRRTG